LTWHETEINIAGGIVYDGTNIEKELTWKKAKMFKPAKNTTSTETKNRENWGQVKYL
jgi:hypothetical protein